MPDLVRFGSFVLDLETGDLHQDGRRVRLPEQQFQILHMLIQRGGSVVSREDIRNRLWPNDTIVEFDRSINAAIMKLRSTLSDTAENASVIETVARRGYRLLVSVKRDPEGPATSPADGRPDAPAAGIDHSSLVGKRVAHYRVLGVQGGGGMGLVYKGEDLKLHRPVALKFLAEELAEDPVNVQRFEREARTASALNHPNICTIYQVEEHGGQPFIVMELLEGETLREVIARMAGTAGWENRHLSMPKLLDMALQIASGLDAAHQKGIIHRDIKPANIFLASKGQVKILDFGLAKQLTASERSRLAEESVSSRAMSSDKGQVVGTPDYMSPEQIKGEPLDQRSDLFSFGVLLCELLSGSHPFRKGTGNETSAAILRDAPNLSGDLPQGLMVLIRRLLVKSVDQRYRSAADVRADLERFSKSFAGEEKIADGQIPLIGRDQEFAELKRSLDEALEGCGSMIMIGGEPGIGKTHLTRALLEEAKRRGAFGVVGHCYEMEGAPPYVPFIEILEYSVRMAPRASIRYSLGDDAPEVARLMPELRTMYSDIPPAIQLPPEQQRRYLFNAFRSYVERAARVTPIVVIFEDLHWADEPTLLLLQHHAQTISTTAMLLIGTYRDVELDVSRPFVKTLETLLRQKLARRISLRRLPMGGVKSMLAAMSGQTPPPSLARVIHEETEGNPFFVEEVFRHLAEEGKLFDENGKWLAGLRVDELRVPEGVRLVLGRRLDRLGQDARRVLTTAAIIGRSFSLRLLEDLENKQPDAALVAIEEAERAHLVIPEPAGRDTRYRFVHELVRQTLAESLSLPRRQRLHARVAEGIERVYAGELEAQSSQLAHHLYQAGAVADPEKTVHFLILAARRARAGAAHEDALAHIEHALSLCEEESGLRVAEAQHLRASTLHSLGRRDEAVACYQKAIDLYEAKGAVEKVAETSLSLSYLQGWMLDIHAASGTTERALKQLSEEFPRLKSALLSMRGAIMSGIGEAVAAEAIFNEVRTISRMLEVPPESPAHLLELIHLYQSFQMDHTVQNGQRFVNACRAAGDSWGISSAEYYLLFAEMYRGHPGNVAIEMPGAVARAEKVGHHGTLWTLMYLAPILSASQGDLAATGREVAAAWEFGEAHQVGWNFINNILRGTYCQWTGDLAETERWYRDGLKMEGRSYLSGLSEASLFAAFAEKKDPRAEHIWKNRSWKLPVAGQLNPIGAWAALERSVVGLAYLGADRELAALRPLTEELVATGAFTYLLLSPFRTAAGIAAAGTRDWTAAEQHHLAAIQQTDTAPYRHLQPVAREWFAHMLLMRRSNGDIDRAKRLLSEALAMHDSLGMPHRAKNAEEMLTGIRS